MIIGLVGGVLLLPLFNDLSGKHLTMPFSGFMPIVALLLLIIIGFVSGSYPAFVLSALRPSVVLKGTSMSAGRQTLRKILVAVQLVMTIFLISSTLLMQQQLSFIQNRDLGFNKEQLLVANLMCPAVD